LQKGIVRLYLLSLIPVCSKREAFLSLRKGAAMAQEDTDLLKIKELIEIMKDNDLLEVEIKHGDDKIFLKRSQPQQPAAIGVPVIGHGVPLPFATPGAPTAPVGPNVIQTAPADATISISKREVDLVEIKSPLVGTFYAQPSPDSEPFVEVGSQISPQTVVCVIEAMKVMNEIKAETSGTIAEIFVTSGQAVEYGQVLFKVKPD